MALSIIPLNTNNFAFQTFNVVLEQQSYEITLQYNPRDESWYIYFGLTNLQPIFKTKITNGTDILKKYRAFEDVPKGSLFVIDNQKLDGRLQRDSFSSGRFSLAYADESTRLLLEEI
jgi:hypothetical protein